MELSGFENFLQISKASLSNHEKLHFVIGNESADLDSIVCSLVYAYYLSTQPNREDFYVALLPLHHEDFELCLEATSLCKMFGISTKDMVFINDFHMHSFRNFKLTLVDHNYETLLQNVEENVVEIIDHHNDTLSYMNARRNIKMVGSCCTLIAEEIFYNRREFLENDPVAELLLAGILLDTINLDLHNGRTTELDLFMSEVLLSYTELDKDDYYLKLKTVQNEIFKMSTKDILRKDYKSVSRNAAPKLGISSITIQSEHFISRTDFCASCIDFITLKNIDVLVLMFLVCEKDVAVGRDLMLFSLNIEHLKKIASFLQIHREKLDLTCKELPVHLDQKAFYFSLSLMCSRKMMLPLLYGL